MSASPRRLSSALPWVALVLQFLPSIVSIFRRKVPGDVVSLDQSEAKDAKKRISRRSSKSS